MPARKTIRSHEADTARRPRKRDFGWLVLPPHEWARSFRDERRRHAREHWETFGQPGGIPMDRALLAYHEAAHAVVATRLGFKCDEVRISHDERWGGWGHASICPEDFWNPQQTYYSALVSLAGPAAERDLMGSRCPDRYHYLNHLVDYAWSTDIADATDLLRELTPRYGRNAWGPLWDSAWKDAHYLVRQNRCAITEVAIKLLFYYRTLGGRRLQHLLRKVVWPTTDALAFRPRAPRLQIPRTPDV